LLSYPPIAPTDVMTNFVAPSALQGLNVGPPWQENIGQQAQTITTTNSTTNLGIEAEAKAGFEIGGIGASLDLKGDYSKSDISGQSLTYDTSTNVQFNYPGLGATPFPPP